ncbi:MAG: hypothetical protein ACK5Q2_08250 [Bacteroidota bacterium]|jgi:hypothetical protein
MTPRQQESIKNKIAKIKAALAADKRRWGGFYDDSRGLRYLPPSLYIKLGDYTGGLRYLTWFRKNFKDDRGFPDFLFECMIILFKSGRLKEAARMAAKTYDLNQYVMDKFLGLPLQILEKKGYQGTDSAEYATEYFIYTRELEGLSDFADWLEKLLQSEAFLVFREKYDQTRLDLDKETNTETRRYLLKFIRQLSDEF